MFRQSQVRPAAVMGAVGLLFVAFTYLNALPAVAELPVRVGVIAAAVVTVGVLVHVLSPTPKSPALLGVAALWGLFLIAVPPRPWTDYASDKVTALFTVALLAVLGGLTLLRSESTRRVWLLLVAALGVVAAWAALTSGTEDSGRLAIEGGSAISAGRASGAAVVVLVALAMGGARRRLACLLAAVVLSVVIVQTGSRGPLLGAGIAVLAVALVSEQRRSLRVLLAAALGGLSWYGVARGGYALDRFTAVGDSGENRLRFWEIAWEQARAHPFGLGWGGMEPLLRGRDYPHNIVLEVLAEAGWLTTAAMLTLIGVALVRQRRAAARNAVELAMYGLLVFYLLNAMVSSDVAGNRGLWVSVGAAIALGATARAATPRRPAALARSST